MDHTWVAHRWIQDLGLPQYSVAVSTHLIDGRLLNVLTKKDMEKHLNIHRKFHQASLLHGVELLRMLHFDKEVWIAVWQKQASLTSKHKIFVYYLYNVGPTSKTLGQRCINNIKIFCVSWVIVSTLFNPLSAGTPKSDARFWLLRSIPALKEKSIYKSRRPIT